MNDVDVAFCYYLLSVAVLVIIVGIVLWIQEMFYQHKDKKRRREQAMKRIEKMNRIREEEKGREVDYFGLYTNVFK